MIGSLAKKVFGWTHGVKLSPNCQLSWSVLKALGEGVRINEKVKVSGDVTIGRFSSINGPNTALMSRINPISTGSFCSIAPNVWVQEYSHRMDRITTYYINRNVFGKKLEEDIWSRGPIIIEDDVWVGANAVILGGVTVGRGSIIGAGAVVTRDIPRYSVAAGNPALKIRERFASPETSERLEDLKWWDWSKSKLVRNHKLFSLDECQIANYDVI